MPIYNVTFDDISPFIRYEGTWVDHDHFDPQVDHYSNSTFHATKMVGATASFNFTGTGVYLFGALRANHGDYSVSVDGYNTIMNGHISTEAFHFPLYVNSSLSYGQHQVVLTNRGSKTFPFVDLDYVTITTGDQKSDTVSDNAIVDDGAFIYGEGWNTSPTIFSPQNFNSTLHQTSVADAAAILVFTGNALSLVGSSDAKRGLFSVTLDGEGPVTLNASTPKFDQNFELYRWDGLKDGKHIVTIKNLEPKALDIDRAIVTRYVKSKKPVGGTVVGAIVGIIAVLLVLSPIVWLIVRRRLRQARRRYGPVKEIVIDDGHDHNHGVGAAANILSQQMYTRPLQDPMNVMFGYHSSGSFTDPDHPPAYNSMTQPMPGNVLTVPATAYHMRDKKAYTQNISPLFPSEKSSQFETDHQLRAVSLVVKPAMTSSSSYSSASHSSTFPQPISTRSPMPPGSSTVTWTSENSPDAVGLTPNIASPDRKVALAIPPEAFQSPTYMPFSPDRKFSVVNPS